jgi:uncharacterized integral membrane protein (TIGR00697 family)
MDTVLIVPLIQYLQSLPAEGVSLILFAVCVVSLLGLFKFCGQSGLYLYNIVAIIASNIQVLRVVQFNLSHEPIALGTVVFATTYLCSDLLTEHYGQAAAQKGIAYAFFAQVLMTCLMVIAVGYPLLSANTHPNPVDLQTEQALFVLFTPSPRLLISSLIAFAISQWADIWIFQTLNRLTAGKKLWFRTFASTTLSALLDTVLFSLLAWVIFSPTPVTLSTLLFTYILGTLVARLLISLANTPVMYLSYLFKPTVLRPQYANVSL